MGYENEFCWALKLSSEQGFPARIIEGGEHEFRKKGNRSYPLNLPIDLVDADWNAVAKVRVTEFTNRGGETTGKFKVIRAYEGNEKSVLSAYWKENRSLAKKP